MANDGQAGVAGAPDGDKAKEDITGAREIRLEAKRVAKQAAADHEAKKKGVARKGAAGRPVRAAASMAKAKLRHFLVAASFVVCVLIPLGVVAFYLYAVADDQYASHVGFSVRTEEVGSAIEFLGGITELSGSSSSDTDILYEFIQSQQIVRRVNEKVDLASIYENPGDPWFGLGSDTRIEALSSYWNRMVKVFYDNASGLIEVRVQAFHPEDAQLIAQLLFDESSQMINGLSSIARADAMSYAEEELVRAVERLKVTRQAKTAFQNRTQIVDPKADITGQMGVLNSLQQQLASSQIELQQLLLDGVSEQDRRVQQMRQKITAINALIDEERTKFGRVGPGAGGRAYSDLLAEFEVLQVDLEFAEKSYLSAQATRDASFAEAQRKSRYLAKHVEPTLAETALYPRRFVTLMMFAGFLLVGWAILTMIYYSLRDRR